MTFEEIKFVICMLIPILAYIWVFFGLAIHVIWNMKKPKTKKGRFFVWTLLCTYLMIVAIFMPVFFIWVLEFVLKQVV